MVEKFLSVEPIRPVTAKKFRRSSNFAFNMITFRIEPFRNVWADKKKSKNFGQKTTKSGMTGGSVRKKSKNVFLSFYFAN